MTSGWGAAEHDIRMGGSTNRNARCCKELQTLAKTWNHPEDIGNCFYGLSQDLNHKLSAAGGLAAPLFPLVLGKGTFIAHTPLCFLSLGSDVA